MNGANGHAADAAAAAASPPAKEGSSKGGKKRLSVERIYQKKTQLEHVLLR